MGTTEVTYVTNNYGISEEELHEILKKERDKFNKVIEKLKDTNKSYKKDIVNQKIEINNLENNIKILENENIKIKLIIWKKIMKMI